MQHSRDTAQRRAIRQVFEEAGRPLSPQEVLDRARESKASTGLATVYRNINHLVEQGWLAPVDIPGEATRYEMAGQGHHHHFHCDRCGRLFTIHNCAGDFRTLVPKGFKLDRHDVILYGRCKTCR